jgi:hypothetical protein
MNWILVELRMALPMSVDVFPCLRVGKCQFGRHQSDNRSVLVVKLLDLKWPSSCMKAPNGKKWRKLADERTRIFGQRMEPDVVDTSPYHINETLTSKS